MSILYIFHEITINYQEMGRYGNQWGVEKLKNTVKAIRMSLPSIKEFYVQSSGVKARGK